jgi:micrococcal nuclease
VRRVLDGDTIDVEGFGRVRLLGIDAPELGHAPRHAPQSGLARGFDGPSETDAPFAQEARDRLASLVLHRWVRLEQEGPALDVYNRHLAYVLLEDGLFVNAALVRDGLARVTARVRLARLDELKRAQAEAQALRRGMWGALPQIPSSGYTRPATGGRARSAQSRNKSGKPPSRRHKTPKYKT